jgi:hypothetical protein
MQMTHKGKGPETYENRETGGSHGGNRYNPEKAPRYNSNMFSIISLREAMGGALHMDR